MGFGLFVVFNRLKHIPIGMALIAAVFLIWFGAGLFGHWPTARHEVQSLAAAGAIAGTGYLIGRNPKALNFCWSVLIWSLLLFCVIALFNFLTAPESADISIQTNFDGRLKGFFGSPNTAATLFGLAALLALGRILLRLGNSNLARLSRRDQIYYFAGTEYVSFTLLVLASLCLLLTVSRAGIFISLLCLIGLAASELQRLTKKGTFSFLQRKRFTYPVGGLFFILIVLAMTGEINPYAQESFFQNSSSRMELYNIYVSVWLERPLLGHGLGSFNALNDSHTTLYTAANTVTIGAAHNVILQWLIQQGVLGTMVMTSVLGVFVIPILGALRKPASKPRVFLRLALAASVLVFGHGMVDFALEIPSVMWTYALILGLAAGFSSVVGADRAEADE